MRACAFVQVVRIRQWPNPEEFPSPDKRDYRHVADTPGTHLKKDHFNLM